MLRSSDSSIQPSIGEPFTTANMPKFEHNPLSPSMEIKAYAGPMSSEQAQTFRKRWKTPPRLIPSSAFANGHNISSSPTSLSLSSPVNSPRMSKSMNEMASSTPKLKKKLFDESEDDDDETFLDNVNGNGILAEHEIDEYQELFDDLLEDKKQMEIEKKRQEMFFKGYRNPDPIMDTPVRAKNDSNSNHLHHNFNSTEKFVNSSDSMFCNVRSAGSTALMTYLDESGSVYNSDNVFESPSFKEKHIRLTDTEKGLESIGRSLAKEQNFGWKEYWTFLGRFIDIRSEDGLECFETFLKQREKLKELNESPGTSTAASPTDKKLNDSFGVSAICASLYSMDLNDELAEKPSRITRNGLTSPSTSISRQSLLKDFAAQQSSSHLHLTNPYTCLEQNLRAFSKVLANLLESDHVQDQSSYEKMLNTSINKLSNSVDGYKRDASFNGVNFQKVHARYSFLLVWYLKEKKVNVKYLRNDTPLISKVYALASHFATQSAKSHAMCVSKFISGHIEKQDKIFNPENVNTETACVDAWNGPDIVECGCSFEANLTSSKHRREIRKKLYSGEFGHHPCWWLGLTFRFPFQVPSRKSICGAHATCRSMMTCTCRAATQNLMSSSRRRNRRSDSTATTTWTRLKSRWRSSRTRRSSRCSSKGKKSMPAAVPLDKFLHFQRSADEDRRERFRRLGRGFRDRRRQVSARQEVVQRHAAPPREDVAQNAQQLPHRHAETQIQSRLAVLTSNLHPHLYFHLFYKLTACSACTSANFLSRLLFH